MKPSLFFQSFQAAIAAARVISREQGRAYLIRVGGGYGFYVRDDSSGYVEIAGAAKYRYENGEYAGMEAK